MKRAARGGCLAAALALLGAAQDFSSIKLDLLAKGFTYADGPAWSSKDGYLIFSDTPSDRLMKWVPGRDPEVFREDAHGPAGNAFDSQGRLYTCETRARRVTRTNKEGAVEPLADRWEGKRLNAPNDLAVSHNDHVYFTDPAFGEQADHRVYHLPPRGPLKLVAKVSGRPNGIALAPNGRVLYVTNSDEHSVVAYDLDRSGDSTGERVLISGITGVPNGIRVDEKGNLYVAAKGILIYSPDGSLQHTMAVHELPSNCGFGEADGKSFFITARGNIYRSRMPLKGAAQ